MFTVFGLNHKTAPLHVREAFATFATQAACQAQFLALPGVHEALWLTTCNRTEVYCDADEASIIWSWVTQQLPLPALDLQTCCYLWQGDDALVHTLRVAIGLDSMMVGEPQILGQLKQAYQHAAQANHVQRNLHQNFQYIFNASKRIRNASGIGRHPISVAFAGAQLIQQYFKRMDEVRVLVIGSGETAKLVTKYLKQLSVQHFMFASRTHQNANQLASAFQGQAFAITELPLYLAKADVVISATACPLPFISQNLVAFAMSERNNQAMFFLDLAVPRDIEASVAELPRVTLYNIDDLHQMIQKNLHQRTHAAAKAEALVLEELRQFQQWQRTLKATDLICGYRQHIKSLATHELSRAKQKLANGQCQYEVLAEFSERLVNKLIHTQTVRLREAAGDDRQDWLDTAQYLLHLPESTL